MLKNGEKFATQEITEKDGWKWTFEDLPKYENGKEIKYTIVEEAVAGYETAIDGFNITNTYKPEKTHIQVTKVWKDNDNKDGKRPESVSVKLLANGVETDKVLVLSETNNWQGGFLDLDVYKSGKKIEYTIKEMNVGSNYEVELTGDAAVGFKLINTHKPRKPELPKTGESRFGMYIGLFAILSASVLVVERSVKKCKED